MESHGLFRVAAATPVVRLADTQANAREIIKQIEDAEGEQVSLLVFPELCITGYTCADLFTQRQLLNSVEAAVEKIAAATRGKDLTAVIGAPVLHRGLLYNCAIVLSRGKVRGIVPKIHLPNTSEFYEARWFTSGAEIPQGSVVDYAGTAGCPISSYMLFNVGDASFGIEICEDLWTPIPPSTYHCMTGAHIIANLSASNELGRKERKRRDLTSQQSSRCHCGYIYSCCGWGESTQDTVYAGASMICEDGEVLAEGTRFATRSTMTVCDLDLERIISGRLRSHTFNSISPDGTHSGVYASIYTHIDLGKAADSDFEKALYRDIDTSPFLPKGGDMETQAALSEIVDIQTHGLARRMDHIRCKNVVIGISGGLDSTLALLVTALAFDKLGLDRKGITGITMPGYGTSARTRGNAWKLMEALGITTREISIAAACDRHFADIGHDPSVHDVTYENSQARERTQILMDVANQVGGIVIGTGDLSELALGWCTYNGDHMSMYGVNAGIPKTLVRMLALHLADSPQLDSTSRDALKDVIRDIVDTPISPELTPTGEDGSIAQMTEDLVGPYELHDFFLYNLLRYGDTTDKLLFLAKKGFAGKYDEKTIRKWLKVFLKRFFTQQFKRSCLPDGPKVTPVSLSPRGDWRMPSDANSDIWVKDL